MDWITVISVTVLHCINTGLVLPVQPRICPGVLELRWPHREDKCPTVALGDWLTVGVVCQERGPEPKGMEEALSIAEAMKRAS